MISEHVVIDPSVKIGKDVTIYPFVYIEKNVIIGDGCVIFPYVSIMEGTVLGKNNHIHQNAVLGAIPQDFNYKGDATELIIGDNNTIRENVVINRATFAGNKTSIGNDNFILEGVHVLHDTHIGNKCVFGYGSKIAGNCEVQDGVILSSNVIVNPKVRIGVSSMIQSGCRCSRDIPPYIVAAHNPIKYAGVNTTILNNIGVDEKVQKHIANAYRLLFHSQTSVFDAVLQIKEQIPESPEIDTIVKFVESSQLGIMQQQQL
jgi:acyl-ACP--UDP-N-acetylglucosamine O-acyltransferase